MGAFRAYRHVEMARAVKHPRVEARLRPPQERRVLPGRPPHDVFVSYCTRDKPVADAIVSRLEQGGIRCWVAPRDVIPGMVWGEAIVEAIETSRLMVVILSGEANESRQVIHEVERAVANDVVVVPFRIDAIEPSRALSYYLASEHWLDAITPPLETHIGELAEVAKALVPIRPAVIEETEEVSPPPPPPSSPPAPASPQVVGPPIMAPPPSPSATRRRRFLVPVVAAAALLLVGGAIAAVAMLSDDDPAAQPAGEQPVVEPPPEAPVPAEPVTPAGVEAPARLRTAYANSSEVKLIWERPADGAKVDHFRVYRDGDPVGKPLETRSFVDNEVEPGARYRYRVVAFGADGSQASSKAVAVKIPSPPPQETSQPTSQPTSQTPSQAPSQGSSQPPPPAQPKCDVVLDEGVCKT